MKCRLFVIIFLVSGFIYNSKAQNVGIGEPNPGSALSVKGNMAIGPDYSSLSAPSGSLMVEGGLLVGTTTADTNAILNLSSSSKGMLVPRLNTIQISAIVNPAPGLLVFNTDSNEFGFASGGKWNYLAVSGSAGSGGSLGAGSSAGNTPYWNGSSWVVNSSNIYNNGGSVGIGTSSPNSSAALDITSTTQGMLPPRMTTTQRNAINVSNTSAVQGLTIFNTTTNCIESFIGTSWQPIGCGCTSAPEQPIGFITSSGTVCQGTNGYAYSVGQVAGASGYAWTLPTGASIATGSGTSAITVNFASNAATGSQTVSVAATNSCGTGTALSTSITVNQLPAITAQPANATICAIGASNTGNTSFSVTATGTALTYQWQVNTGSGFTNISNGGVYSNATTSTLNITGATTAYSGYTYQCVVSGTCSPSVTSNSATLTVNPVPSVTNPTTVSICSGAGANISLTATASSTFAWTIGSITGSITGSSAGSGSSINQTLTDPSNSASGTVPYIVVPTSTAGSCVGSSTTITVTVNPVPALTLTPSSTTLCSGSATSIALSSTVSGTTYSWSSTEASGISGASSGTASTIAQTLSNSSNSTSATATYTVTATTGASCSVTGSEVVTVNPIPSITATPSSAAICSGSAPSIALTSSASGTTYTWSVAQASGISGGSSSSGTPIAQTLSNSSNTTSATATYTVTGTANSCSASITAVITVNPVPAVTATPSSSSICTGTAPSIALSSSLGSTTYAWSVAQASGITGGSSGSGTPIAQTLSNSNSTSATATYTITGTESTHSCSASITSVVTVNPLPTVTVSANNNPAAINTSITLTATPAGGSGTYSSYAWSSSTTGNGMGASTTSTNTATPTATGTQTYSVKVTDNNGCQSSAAGSVNVTVNNNVVVVDNTSCPGGDNNSFSVSTSHANELIVIFMYGGGNGYGSSAVKVDGNNATQYTGATNNNTSGGGLCGGPAGTELNVWYYAAASSGSHTITMSESGVAPTGTEFVNFAVSCYNPSGGSLSGSNLGIGTGYQSDVSSGTASVTTSTSVPANSYLLGFAFNQNTQTSGGSNAFTWSSNMTQICSTNLGNAAWGGAQGTEQMEAAIAAGTTGAAGSQTVTASYSNTGQCAMGLTVFWVHP